MRYLLNLPLLLALGSTLNIVYFTMLSSPSGGTDGQLANAYLIFFSTGISWLMFAVVLVGCAGMGGFKWLPAGSGAAIVVVLLAFAAIILVTLKSTYINMDASGSGGKWAVNQIWSARIVTAGWPIALGIYLAWIINAPEGFRDAPMVRNSTLGGLIVFCLLASVVTFREQSRLSQVAQVDAAVQDQEEVARQQDERRAFEALTDADPLLSWYQYANYNVPDDVRIEALRRIAARPKLEAELTETLACGGPEAMSLIVRLPFTPSAALEKPIRGALEDIIGRFRKEATQITYDGDKRIDYYEQSTLNTTLAVAERMAESAGVDLGDELDEMQRAVALYPKSDAAYEFPGRVRDAKKTIAKSLATRRKAA